MAFQIKDFASITASCINWMRATTTRITDFNIGSVARTLVEAPAVEIEELYQQMFVGLREAIPASVYSSFDFERLPASQTAGLVRVTITSSASTRSIPSSTRFLVASRGLTYLTLVDVTVPAGASFVDVPVVAESPGIAWNIPAGLTFSVEPAPDGYVSAANIAPFSSGSDSETDEQRKLRFNAYIQSLNRGTVEALRYGLGTSALYDSMDNETERVALSQIVEPWLTDNTQPPALVNCYVHNGVGSTSGALVLRAREVLYGYTDASGVLVPGWKAAGVKVEVFAATEQAVAVTAVLTAATGYDKPTLILAAREAIYSYLLGLGIGATAIRSEIIAKAMEVEGVTNFVVTAPAGDTTAANGVKLMPGTFTLT